LQLYAQHVDPIDTGTLLDMFRADATACLLGTDAVRDGVDVPGESLKLIVLDRVPWSQPSILERARRQVFGGGAYQDMMIRLKLRQAFGRLIRRACDRGVFVVLDPRLASRFATAFPLRRQGRAHGPCRGHRGGRRLSCALAGTPVRLYGYRARRPESPPTPKRPPCTPSAITRP
jgi:Rad3-related DNA helicase